jgi:hypothetical protein
MYPHHIKAINSYLKNRGGWGNTTLSTKFWDWLISRLKRKQYLVKRPQSGLDTKTCWLTVSHKVNLDSGWPPLWSRGQSSWLSLVSTTEELLGRKSSGSGLESQEYGSRDPPRSPRDTAISAKFGTNFDDKRRSLGRCSSLVDSGHGIISYIHFFYHPSLFTICTSTFSKLVEGSW